MDQWFFLNLNVCCYYCRTLYFNHCSPSIFVHLYILLRSFARRLNRKIVCSGLLENYSFGLDLLQNAGSESVELYINLFRFTAQILTNRRKQ